MRDLGAERGREARAQRALIARGDEGARLVDRKAVPRRKADLRQFVGDDGVFRQHLAQDVQIGHLRLDRLDLLLRRGRSLADRGAAAVCLRVSALAHRREQFARPGLRVGDHSYVGRIAAHFRRHRYRCGCDFSPSGRKGQRDIVANSSRVPMPIMRSVCGHSRYAAAIVSPSSWALETMPRPLRNATTGASISSASSRISSRRVDGARADEDHRRLARRDQRRGVLDALGVRLRRRKQIERL